MAEPKFVDPTKIPYVFANGPLSAIGMGDLLILTFTQALPLVEGQPTSKIGSIEYDLRVVARVGIPRAQINELFKLVQGLAAAITPPAGSA
jgi:hypothetical protein